MSESAPGGRTVAASRMATARVMTLLDTNDLGNVHGGVVMREVDTAAGLTAARHAGRQAVTASIDELSFLQPVRVGDLLHVMASVNATGETSMEVGVRVEAEDWRTGERRHTTSAYLVFVALDDGKPFRVPPLVVETDVERHRQAQAGIRRQARKERLARLGTYLAKPQLDPDE